MEDVNYSELTYEEAKALMDEAVKGQSFGTIHPKLAEKLMELGLLNVKEAPTLDEVIDLIREHAHEMQPKLPPIPQGIEEQFKGPYMEARSCLLFGIYGASVTQSAILIEHALKWFAFCVEVETTEDDLPEDHWEKIESMKFGNAVGYAKKHGLIDKEISKRLDIFRKDVRNVQAHQQVYKATKGAEFRDSSSVDFATKKVEVGQTVSAHSDPIIAAKAKEARDREIAPKAFIFMQRILEHLHVRFGQILEGHNPQGPKESIHE